MAVSSTKGTRAPNRPPTPRKPAAGKKPTGTHKRNQAEPVFGFTNGIVLVVILCASIGVAVLLHSTTLDVTLSRSLAFPWIGIALWLAELGIYFFMGWNHPDRNARVALVGVIAGLSAHPLLYILLAKISHIEAAHIVHILTVITITLIMAYPCNQLFELEDRPSAPAKRPKDNKDASGKFSFNTARKAGAPIKYNSRPLIESMEEEAQHLTPPPDFTSMPPQDEVIGVVKIPQKVIFESIPEAKAHLRAEGGELRVRLAVIVPQLRRGTVWLTWQQIFPGGPEDPNRRIYQEQSEHPLQGRWVRIPPKYYALQVPPEHYVKSRPLPLLWMQRPPVPQETLFTETVKQ